MKFHWCGICGARIDSPPTCEKHAAIYERQEMQLAPIRARANRAIVKPIMAEIKLHQTMIADAEQRINKAIADALDMDPANILADTGGHSYACRTSPTGRCIYDHAKDPCLDNCLLCNSPLRKEVTHASIRNIDRTEARRQEPYQRDSLQHQGFHAYRRCRRQPGRATLHP